MTSGQPAVDRIAESTLHQLKAKAEQDAAAQQAPATLRKLFEFYVDDLEARRKSADTIIRAVTTAKAVERTMPALLDTPVSALTDRDVYAFVAARSKAGAKPGTINRDLRTLRAALKHVRPDYRLPKGAFLPADDTRVRWLRPDEEITVLEVMPSPFREIAKLAALTLMRQGEIRTLRPEFIYLDQGVIQLPKAKGGARAVTLSEAAQKIIRAQLEATEGKEWLFPGPDGGPYSRVHVSRVFRKAARAAGLRDFRFHDLRHHGATMALNAGYAAPIVMDLGGWKSEKMMRRYAAVTDQTRRAAAEAVSGSRSSVYPTFTASGTHYTTTQSAVERAG